MLQAENRVESYKEMSDKTLELRLGSSIPVLQRKKEEGDYWDVTNQAEIYNR